MLEDKIIKFIEDELSQREEMRQFIEKYYIPKSKIKEKIEELTNKDLEIYDTDSEDIIISKYEERAVLDFCKELLN